MVNQHPLRQEDTQELADAQELHGLYWLWIEEPFNSIFAGTVQDLAAYKKQGLVAFQLCRCVEMPLNENTYDELERQYHEAKAKARGVSNS